MCVQLSVIRELETLSTKHGAIGQLARLNLFELFVERLEWPGAKCSAAKWYRRAIEEDPTAAAARYALGFFELLQHSYPRGMDLLSLYAAFARKGCYHSLMELRQRFPSRFLALRKDYRRHGGLLRREEKHDIFHMHRYDDFEGYFSHVLAEEDNEGFKLGEMLVSKNNDGLLHAAARYGCASAIDHLLSLGVDVNITNRAGETALFQACRAGSLEAVEHLLDNGANPAIAAANGETPLHWVFAFDDGDVERATHLLLLNGGEACLHATIAAGDSSAVEYLPLYGTPLHFAILARNETAARSLLSAGADPFIRCDHELVGGTSHCTPFKLAIRELLPSIIKIMIVSPTSGPRLGGYLASMKESILHFAIKSSSKAIRRVALGAKYVSVLIETIDLLQTIEGKERPLEFGMSLLHASIVYGLPVEVIEHLLETGCREDLELVSRPHRHTPLQVAMHLNREKTFLLLLKYGADTHRKLQFPEGVSYLHFCAHLGPRGVFYAKELIARGPIHHEGGEGPGSLSQFPPPFFALVMGNFDLATFLARGSGSTNVVQLNIDVFWLLYRFFPRLPVSRLRYLLEPPAGLEPRKLIGQPTLGRTCFHSIVNHHFRGELELITGFRYLLKQSELRGQRGLLNQPDAMGMPPLVTAITFGRLDIVGEMLAAGADPNLGAMTSVNWAYLFLKRLQKSPSQYYVPSGGLPLSRREARWLQDDFKSMILLLKQYGGQEMRMSNGMIDFPYWSYFSRYPKLVLCASRDEYRRGREYGKQLIAQHGVWKGLQEMWKHAAAERIRTSKKNTLGPLDLLASSVRSSWVRYQEDLAKRERFSTGDDVAAGASETHTPGARTGGIAVRIVPPSTLTPVSIRVSDYNFLPCVVLLEWSGVTGKLRTLVFFVTSNRDRGNRARTSGLASARPVPRKTPAVNPIFPHLRGPGTKQRPSPGANPTTCRPICSRCYIPLIPSTTAFSAPASRSDTAFRPGTASSTT